MRNHTEGADPINRFQVLHREALAANRRERELLDEMGALLFGFRTVDNPTIVRGMAYIAEHRKKGVIPEDALTPDEFRARGQSQAAH
jgi:hypothetical protein